VAGAARSAETRWAPSDGGLSVLVLRLAAHTQIDTHTQIERVTRTPCSLCCISNQREGGGMTDRRMITEQQRAEEQGVQQVSQTLFHRVTSYHAQIAWNVHKHKHI